MIKVKFKGLRDCANYSEWIKTFKGENCFDEFLTYYFNSYIDNYEILEGQEIITGEIQQKGINNN